MIFYKPETSREENTEVYLICENQGNYEQMIVDSEFETFK